MPSAAAAATERGFGAVKEHRESPSGRPPGLPVGVFPPHAPGRPSPDGEGGALSARRGRRISWTGSERRTCSLAAAWRIFFASAVWSACPARCATTCPTTGRPTRARSPDQVERLVPHELVGETQAAVHHVAVADDDAVVFARALREPLRPEVVVLGEETERPGRGEVLGVDVGSQDEGDRLAADGRVREVDGIGDAELFRRADLDPLPIFAVDGERPRDARRGGRRSRERRGRPCGSRRPTGRSCRRGSGPRDRRSPPSCCRGRARRRRKGGARSSPPRARAPRATSRSRAGPPPRRRPGGRHRRRSSRRRFPGPRGRDGGWRESSRPE